MLIDSSYFINEIFIAGQANSVDVESSRSKLSGFIAKYEPRFLDEFLGHDLKIAFLDGLQIQPIPEKWQNLKNILVNEETKESPIANYVYFFYKRNEVTTTTGVGEFNQLSENAERASSIDKQVMAWNEMLDLSFKIYDFLKNNQSDYPYILPFKNCRDFNFRYRKINSLNL